MKEPTPAEILAAIRVATAPTVEIDPNWKTVREWAAAWGLSRSQASKHCQEAQDKGVMRSQMMRRLNGQRGVWRVACYRFVGDEA